MTSKHYLAEWSGHQPSCSSRTCGACSLQTAGTLWPESFQGWPVAATWDGTGLSELPTLEPATDGNGCSSEPTLPTPRANRTVADSHGVSTYDLLPTPTAHDDGKSPEAYSTMRRNLPGGPRSTISSLSVLARNGMEPMLPTPTASDAKGPSPNHGGTTAEAIEALGSARIGPPSTGGNEPSDDQHPTPLLNTPTVADSIRWKVSKKAKEKYGATTLLEQLASIPDSSSG